MARFAHERLPEFRGNLTQTDLANRLRAKGYGTTQTTVSRWEAGQQPRAYVLPALARELGVSVDDLFADDEEEADLVMDRAERIHAAMRPLARELAVQS